MTAEAITTPRTPDRGAESDSEPGGLRLAGYLAALAVGALVMAWVATASIALTPVGEGMAAVASGMPGM